MYNMAIKGKYKEFYMSDILLVEYKKMKKIIKQYGLVLILKKKSFKQKVSLVFLYMNRNITYYLLNFFYDIKSLIYKFFWVIFYLGRKNLLVKIMLPWYWEITCSMEEI